MGKYNKKGCYNLGHNARKPVYGAVRIKKGADQTLSLGGLVCFYLTLFLERIIS